MKGLIQHAKTFFSFRKNLNAYLVAEWRMYDLRWLFLRYFTIKKCKGVSSKTLTSIIPYETAI